jgi:hypothetical protein
MRDALIVRGISAFENFKGAGSETAVLLRGLTPPGESNYQYYVLDQAHAASAANSPLAPFSIDRREPTPTDVQIEILFCGVCHSDLHIARNEWGGTTYPCVPGHEIAGRVVKVGKDVKKFKEGDLAAVGCLVNSDRVCENCRAILNGLRAAPPYLQQPRPAHRRHDLRRIFQERRGRPGFRAPPFR